MVLPTGTDGPGGLIPGAVACPSNTNLFSFFFKTQILMCIYSSYRVGLLSARNFDIGLSELGGDISVMGFCISSSPSRH
jgi:hypothetical protein